MVTSSTESSEPHHKPARCDKTPPGSGCDAGEGQPLCDGRADRWVHLRADVLENKSTQKSLNHKNGRGPERGLPQIQMEKQEQTRKLLTKCLSAKAYGCIVSTSPGSWPRSADGRIKMQVRCPTFSSATAIVTDAGRTHLSRVSLGFLFKSPQIVSLFSTAAGTAAGARDSFSCISSYHSCPNSS